MKGNHGTAVQKIGKLGTGVSKELRKCCWRSGMLSFVDQHEDKISRLCLPYGRMRDSLTVRMVHNVPGQRRVCVSGDKGHHWRSESAVGLPPTLHPPPSARPPPSQYSCLVPGGMCIHCRLRSGDCTIANVWAAR